MASKPDLAGLLTAIALVLVAAGCSKESSPAETGGDARPLTIYAVNYPLAYFAERLAPEQAEVVLPVPRDVDPAFWKPSPEVIGQYQHAGVILLNGAGYARWTDYATLPATRTVVTAEGCRESFLPSGVGLKHQHGPDGEHAHGDTAFTTWLDLRLALCQARHIRDALVDLVPSEEKAIASRFSELASDLTELDARLRAAAAAWGDRPVLASHPVYQYLADAYDLQIQSLHFEPTEPLDSDALRALDAAREKHPGKLMLWEAAPPAATVAELAKRGVETVVFDPASVPPPTGDFLTVMRVNAKRFGCATGSEACP